jgi:sugar fermentation stimulation protein A
MNFPAPLVPGALVRRYKRFLADVRLESGEVVVAHCPNPGRMTTCAVAGGRVLLSPALNPKRKLRWTWEIAYAGEGGEVPILVNTARPNAVVSEALAAGAVPGLTGYAQIRSEVRYGAEKSRIDFLLSGPERPDCYVEVKSVTLLAAPGVAAFPDARTERGERHLRELAAQVGAGNRAALVFLLSRGDAAVIRPADDIDPAYGRALRAAAAGGLELIGLRAAVTPEGVTAGGLVPVELPPL